LMRLLWRNGAQVPAKIVVNGEESKFLGGI